MFHTDILGKGVERIVDSWSSLFMKITLLSRLNDLSRDKVDDRIEYVIRIVYTVNNSSSINNVHWWPIRQSADNQQ